MLYKIWNFDTVPEIRRVKHLELRYYFLRNQVERGRIKLTYIRTEDQLADIFTKPLAKDRFQSLRKLIDIQN